MATTNPFDLLGDDDNDDPSQLIASLQEKLPPPPKKSAPQSQGAAGAAAQPAPLPSKPAPPNRIVREPRSRTEPPREVGSGRGRGFARGRGGGGGGFNRDSVNNDDAFGSTNGYSGGYRAPEEGDSEKPSERRPYGGPRDGGPRDSGPRDGGHRDFGPRDGLRDGPRGGGGGGRGGRRGGFTNGEVSEGERPRRVFERRSGTGRGSDLKRDGSGRGNWGTPTDEITPENEELAPENEKTVEAEKEPGQEDAGDANKETSVVEPEEKEPEEMTLGEYEKILEEKRKALLALKTEERKVELDKELKAMQVVSSKKKNDDDIFIKLGSEKDKREKAAEKEEKAKKSVSINEFLKPAEGERYSGGGRRGGRGRGGPRGGFSGSGSHAMNNHMQAPPIADATHFPSLGGK